MFIIYLFGVDPFALKTSLIVLNSIRMNPGNLPRTKLITKEIDTSNNGSDPMFG